MVLITGSTIFRALAYFWENKMFQGLFMPSMLQAWDQAFLQGALVPFNGEEYIETKFWVLLAVSLLWGHFWGKILSSYCCLWLLLPPLLPLCLPFPHQKLAPSNVSVLSWLVQSASIHDTVQNGYTWPTTNSKPSRWSSVYFPILLFLEYIPLC